MNILKLFQLSLQQYGYLVTEFNDESNFVSERFTLGDAIRMVGSSLLLHFPHKRNTKIKKEVAYPTS
jgi:hypothetical protein